MTTAGAPLSFEGPVYVVCEGNSDRGFLEHLIDSRQLAGFTVGYPTSETAGADGVSGIRKLLLAIDTSSDRPKLKGLLVIVDADENPAQRFAEIRGALAAMGCDIREPFAPRRVEGKNLTVEVFLMPGRGRKGTLEHLLLDGVFERNRQLESCVNGFRDCLKGPAAWPDNKQAKMRLHALIAGCCEEEPSTNLATLWNKKGNPIPLASAKFDELVETLRAFAAL
jgi:Protein of unknown function (DUF3226)